MTLMQAAHKEATAKLETQMRSAQEAVVAQQATVAARDNIIAELEEQLKMVQEKAASFEAAVGNGL